MFWAAQDIAEDGLKGDRQIFILGCLGEASDPDIIVPAPIVQVLKVAVKVPESGCLRGELGMYLRDFELDVSAIFFQ